MKEIDWGFIRGEGTIICSCNNCGREYEYDFDDGYPDYKDCQKELNERGWLSKKIGDTWYDFCCERCYQEFINKKDS